MNHLSASPLETIENRAVNIDTVRELTIVAPTFNERDNLNIVVERLEQVLGDIGWEVVFVDDDSPDGTADIARGIAQHDLRVRVIHRIGRRGLSSACVEGALSSSAPFIAVIDADLQHDVGLLPEMLRRLKQDGLDIAIGSRYVEGGSTEGWERRRLLMSRLAVRAAQLLTRVPLADPMSGFFMVRREAFVGAVPSLSQQGFKILLDLMASSPRPLTFVEIPYQFGARAHGTSKFDGMAAWQFGLLVLDKMVGRFLPLRFILFAFVGGTGVIVSLGALWVFLRTGIAFDRAQTAAVIIAMTSNFILNNSITYRDRKLRGWALLRGLLTFYLVCGIGAVANVGIASLLYSGQQVWWVAGLAGAVVGAVWNYVATQLFTWRRN